MSGPRCMLAEAIGTFFLCFAGIAAILSAVEPTNSGGGIVGVALAHGLALSVAVAIFGGISGAHVNPAVTIGMLVTGRMTLTGTLQYIVAQLAGASLAALACLMIFPASTIETAKLGIPLPTVMPADGVQWPTIYVILGLEFIMTFLLMTAIYGTAVDSRGERVNIGGFGIGLTLAFNILAGGAVTGASLNPARSFGPALVFRFTGSEAGAHAFQLHWCYWVAPIAGAMVAAWIYNSFLMGEDNG